MGYNVSGYVELTVLPEHEIALALTLAEQPFFTTDYFVKYYARGVLGPGTPIVERLLEFVGFSQSEAESVTDGGAAFYDARFDNKWSGRNQDILNYFAETGIAVEAAFTGEDDESWKVRSSLNSGVVSNVELSRYPVPEVEEAFRSANALLAVEVALAAFPEGTLLTPADVLGLIASNKH